MKQRASIAVERRSTPANDQLLHSTIASDLLLTLLEQSPAGIALVESTTLRLAFANRQFQQLLDTAHQSSDLTGRSLHEVIPTAAAKEIGRLIEQVSRLGRIVTHFALRLDGIGASPAYWDITIAPLQAYNISTSRIMVQVVDVSEKAVIHEEHERLRALADLRGEQFGAAMERIADGVVVVDVEGKVRRINPAGIAMLDLDTPDTAAEESSSNGPPGESSGRYQIDLPPLHLSLRGQTVHNYEHSVERRSGELIWLNVSSAPIYDRHGIVRGAVAGIQDISERRRMEQIKDDFLATTAHELRTPVTALLGYTNLLVRRAEQGDWNERDVHALRMVEAQAQRLTQLVNGLIDVSHLQAGAIELHWQRVDAVGLAQQAAARLSTTDHTIKVLAPAEPVIIWGDAQRLDQIISHLIGNAVKYSPWGGDVVVDIRAGEAAHISVSDHGIGIPAEELPYLFDRFFRATNVDSDRISGLGIGLYVVKELVVAHGGMIEARSAPGEGTTIEIMLPLYRAGDGGPGLGVG